LGYIKLISLYLFNMLNKIKADIDWNRRLGDEGIEKGEDGGCEFWATLWNIRLGTNFHIMNCKKKLYFELNVLKGIFGSEKWFPEYNSKGKVF